MEVLGIDIGGSAVKAAPVDTERGVLLAERLRLPTAERISPEQMAELVAAAVNHFAWRGPVGVGFPAVVQHGVALSAANISADWIGDNLQARFTEATGLPVTALNDADAAGLAEMRFGAGAGRAGTVILVTIGTGLGTALFCDGVLFPNTELGHLTLKGQDAERYASDAARKRKGLSWKQWGRRFNRYLQLLDQLFSPELIILGGGASRRHEKFLPQLAVRGELAVAQLQNDAGIVGAALAACPLPASATGPAL